VNLGVLGLLICELQLERHVPLLMTLRVGDLLRLLQLQFVLEPLKHNLQQLALSLCLALDALLLQPVRTIRRGRSCWKITKIKNI
jgi:hypothetical protein